MEVNKSIKILKALADSSRLVIINSLMKKPQYVEELSERLDLAASTVSFHLKKLEEAGLVIREKEQYYVVFYLNFEIFKSPLLDLIELEKADDVLHEERILKYKQKILKTFFKHNHLVKIPVQYKKKLVILEEICKNFKENKTYSEKEIDEKISSYFDDYVSIRRYLIDFKFLKRAEGKYTLIKRSIDKDSEIFSKQIKAKSKIDTHDHIHDEKNKMEKNMDNKAELKRQYKEMEIPKGIIQVKNHINNKIFIDKSVNLQATINKFKFLLNQKSFMHPKSKTEELQNDWDKYGENNFSFEILDRLKPKDDPAFDIKEELDTLLKLWLDKLQPYGEKGYNK